METKVKNYTDKQLLNRVRALPSYKGLPKDYWILGVQSNEDTYNQFDDKFYLFRGKDFVKVVSGTTNAGSTGLKNYNKYGLLGTAVIKTDEWYYGLWRYGLHKKKMPALKQIRPIKYYRDNNKNNKVEEMGKMYEGMIGIDFHTVTYQHNLPFWRKFIGGWSMGCQVVNHVKGYYQILKAVKHQNEVTYCLIKEF